MFIAIMKSKKVFFAFRSVTEYIKVITENYMNHSQPDLSLSLSRRKAFYSYLSGDSLVHLIG